MFLVLFYFSQSSTHQPSFPTNSSEPKVSFLAYWGIFWQIHVLFDTHNMGVSTVSVVSPVGHTLSTASSWCWKQKRVIASSTYHEPVTRVNMGFTICGLVLLCCDGIVRDHESWSGFSIQKWGWSMSSQEFVVVWKLPALIGEELDELFNRAWILLGILIVCFCFLLLLEIASGSSFCILVYLKVRISNQVS